jgi:hypothetical protein
MSGFELQGLKTYQAKDLLLSALAHLFDDDDAQLPDVEKILYAATDEAWKEFEATHSLPFPSPIIYPPRGTVLHAFELRDFYKPHRPRPVARFELVSA